MWLNENNQWCRNCPKCNCIIACDNKEKWIIADRITQKRMCGVCHSNISKGKHHSQETKKVLSDKGKKRYSNFKEKKKMSNLIKQSWKDLTKRNNRLEGKKYMMLNHSDRYRKNLSIGIKNAWKNPEIKKKYYDALSKTKYLKVRADRGQIELLEKWNKLGFNFEPNYQIHTDRDLFYIDGYDKERNVVLEYDGKYHNRKQQREKDLVRQQRIIELLKPKKFWRYNSANKTINNVLES